MEEDIVAQIMQNREGVLVVLLAVLMHLAVNLSSFREECKLVYYKLDI